MSEYASFAKATLERAIKTFAQTLAALLVADGTDLLGTAWSDRLSIAGMAAVVSVLTSVGSGFVGGTGPSVANEVISPPAVDPADRGSIGLGEALVVCVVLVLLVVLLTRI
jgi:hypothetical protein